MTKIKITDSRKDEPLNLHLGFIGFKDFEEARKTAEKTNGEVVILEVSAQGRYFHSRGKAEEPLTLIKEDYPETTDGFSSMDECMQFIRKELTQDFINNTDFKEFKCKIDDLDKVLNETSKMRPGQIVLVKGCRYYGTVDKEIMKLQNENRIRTIGVETKQPVK